MKQVTAIMYTPLEDDTQLLGIYVGNIKGQGIRHARRLLSEDGDHEVRLIKDEDSHRLQYVVQERYCSNGEWEEWNDNGHRVHLESTNLLPVLT